MARLLSMLLLLFGFLAFDAEAAPSTPSANELLEAAGQASSAEDAAESKHEEESGEEAASEDDDDAESDGAESEAAAETDAEDDDEGEDGDEGEERDLHNVVRKDVSREVAMDGVFVAEEMEAVALRPDVWAEFKVVDVVQHGERVRKGDVLVKFDDRKFEESLEQKSLEQRLAEVALMQAEEEFPRTEKSIEIAYTRAKRAHEHMVDQYKRFRETTRPMSEKMAMQSLASSQFALESAQEELEQLQQMYDADELTEETEEIVLKRQKFAVARSKLYLESARISYDYTMNISLPRQEEAFELDLEAARLAHEKAKMAQTLGLNQQRYELEKLREARERSVQQHAKLVADRGMLQLRAPIDGIVYYGRCVDGKFSEVAALKAKLIPFGTIPANTVVMTVADNGAMCVFGSVDENEFTSLKEGQSAQITLVADDGMNLAGSVKQISGVPQPGNKFAVALEVELDGAPEWLVPGMTCKSSVTVYEAEDAVVLPSDLVQADEDDDDQKYVMVLDDEGELVRRDLELGEKSGKDVVVEEGLDEGDRVVKGAAADDSGDEDDDEEDEDDENDNDHDHDDDEEDDD